MNDKIINYDHINHIELRSDLENDANIGDFTREGKISNTPETWAIESLSQDYSYQYDSKSEYEEDCTILGI